MSIMLQISQCLLKNLSKALNVLQIAKLHCSKLQVFYESKPTGFSKDVS